jgi:hypothetical protein
MSGDMALALIIGFLLGMTIGLHIGTSAVKR